MTAEPPPPPAPAPPAHGTTHGGNAGRPVQQTTAWLPPGGHAPRRTARPLVVVAAVVGALLIVVGVAVPVALLTRSTGSQVSAPATTPAPVSPAAAQARAAYQQALAAIRSSPGFHYIAQSIGPLTQRIDGDAGRDGGRQVITLSSTYGPEQFTLLLTGGVVYFQGNGSALQDQLGVPASRTAALNAKWISVIRADGPYPILQPGITVDDQAQETALVPTSVSSATAAGSNVTRILGTIPARQGAPAGTARLDLATDSKLPLSYESTISANGVTLASTTTFSAWGTAPSVAAPTGAVSWATLGASAPPGGYGSGGGSAAASPSPPGSI